ncbi:translation initiation factor IF-2 [Myxococcus fulvus]|uniref:Translation initiation factor IF-2 n=1 Tax=Myxococcus fulvus TaxID=33 RepID=A0A511SWV6_MYXFU|nr:hypothetical protein [Myxococcus fulvus]GEN06027.1 hypothetical protein MFU01_10640 [Myxococcus fulvus]SET60425.1 translation initiation factor IF-2 [Myxococcus fulvus]
MANGQRRGAGPGRNEEPRIAPEDEDATRDIPMSYAPEETRVAPPDPPASETRIGPQDLVDEQEDIVTEARKGQNAPPPRGVAGRGPEARGAARGQEVIVTEARSNRSPSTGDARAGRGQEAIVTEARPSRPPARGGAESDPPPKGRAGGRAPPEDPRGRAGARGAQERIQELDLDEDEDTNASAAHAGGDDEEFQLFTSGGAEDEHLPFATELRGGGSAPAAGMRGGSATEVRDGAAPAVRGGSAPAGMRGGPTGEGRGGSAPATEVRGGSAPATEVRGGSEVPGGPPRVERVKVPASNWLSRGSEKPQAPGGLAAGVVRLSPLEPAAGKVAAAAEEGPALRTMFANHSALLAEQLREALSKKMYGRGPHRVLRIDEPEGPSTAGGKLARQNISLVPRKGSGPSLVCGWVDVSKREAQLRNHDAVAKRYESHHGEPLELVAEEYERFLNDVEEVLAKAVIKVRLIVPEEQAGARMVAPAVQARAKGGVPMVLVLVLMGLAFAFGLFVGKAPG